ncbi:hypothetical protein [Chitinophaga flava]|uniref:Uncharacterized protein n=1 Tax=Chitinophaga flava TaxID=2259036 RepID=A0A365XU69_9BACT|nr:hypothetical protein [Chitinophaga flava]RBL89561.1 hypothetical protein DF182_23925 [Chitinophaga flava]
MTHYDISKLEHLERKTEWKKNYAYHAAVNQLLMLPVLLITGGSLTFFLLQSRQLHSIYGLIASIAILTGILLFVLIARRGKKQVLANISQKQVCLAKILKSNAHSQVYYGIFSTNDTRWDTALLQHISDRVINISADTNNPDNQTVAQLLESSLITVGMRSQSLPTSFTGGHEIYVKPFDFSNMDKAAYDYIQHRNGIFPVLYVNHTYVPVVLRDYIIALDK